MKFLVLNVDDPELPQLSPVITLITMLCQEEEKAVFRVFCMQSLHHQPSRTAYRLCPTLTPMTRQACVNE